MPLRQLRAVMRRRAEYCRRMKARHFKARHFVDKAGACPRLQEGASLRMRFEEPSTRTRVSCRRHH